MRRFSPPLCRVGRTPDVSGFRPRNRTLYAIKYTGTDTQIHTHTYTSHMRKHVKNGVGGQCGDPRTVHQPPFL